MPGPNGNRMPGGRELPAAAALLAGIGLVAVPCRAVNVGSGEVVKRVAPLNNIMASIRSQVLCAISSSFRVTALADMDETAPVPREAYKKLPSGVIIADLRPGKREDGVVKNGSRVNLQWVRSLLVLVSSSVLMIEG